MPHDFLLPITGSFAMPAAENPTVAMIEAAFRHHGLNWRYINLEVAPENLGDAVRGARAMGWRGFNCSIPHKVAVIDHLDGLGASAAIIGAVNTVVRRGDALIGGTPTARASSRRSARSAIPPGGGWCCSAPAARRGRWRWNWRWPGSTTSPW